MAHADMTERVEHAFMGEDAVGQRKLRDDIGQSVGHGQVLEMAAAPTPLPQRNFIMSGTVHGYADLRPAEARGALPPQAKAACGKMVSYFTVTLLDIRLLITLHH